jgi:hypothetical protein
MQTNMTPRIGQMPLCGLALPEACPWDEAPPFDGPAIGAVTAPRTGIATPSECIQERTAAAGIAL